MMSIVQVTTKEELREHLKTKKIVLINFWAEWCGPCKMFKGVLKELNEEFSGKVKIIRVNVEKSPDIAAEYKVMGIPHSRLIIHNKLREPIIGYVPYEELKHMIGI
ncbi:MULTISPECIES: thioredoxin family protein [unclassified Lysinibacillus]|uniref:thioredoxin family protein n=1 Tax=unclassified Lysinibacillus TaxID=2636778 RepID=UPI00201325EE|nr:MULTISPECIES: thioredoxin family protein [unclassified Lysinibacillus]MCL1694629.1 thioredoxin family protein [Lysinibacillus sp. BPa_S21]MCL1699490.1 thioredoxin family protein [Lysinibacillus sp. Bpr_S20]